MLRRRIARHLPVLAVLAGLLGVALIGPIPAVAVGEGARWSDGDYTVSLASHATLPGAGVANAAGAFTLEIANGSGSAPYEVTYVFTGVGVSAGGTVMSGTLAIHISGRAVADGGHVTLVRDHGELEWLEACEGATCIDPRTSPYFRTIEVAAAGEDPLVASGSSCGMIEGRWTGIVDDLVAGVPGVDLGSALDGLSTTFLAGSTRLGDFGLWLEERNALLDDIYTLVEQVATLGPADLDAAAREAVGLVDRGERLRNELTTDYCPDYATGGIGITEAMRDLLFALLGNPEVSARALADFLRAGSRAGALPTGDPVVDEAILNRLRELEAGTDDLPARYTFAIVAGQLGDRALADRFLGEAE